MKTRFNYTSLFIAAWLLGTAPQAQSSGLGSLLDSAASLSAGQEDNIDGDLLSRLSSQLGISEAQASGGTAALLAYAQQQLSSDESSLLSNIIPAADNTSLSSQVLQQISSMDSVKQAFSALGLDAKMIEQFAPIILQYIGDKGGANLVDSLSKIWS